MKSNSVLTFISLIIGSVIPYHYALSQSLIPELVATPNASNIARYGDIPISYYTGRANITIPLYSFTQDNVPLDISLSYDTSGLPINMLPGWTGHGWTLNAGGSITRVMNRSCDEHYMNSSLFHNYFQSYQDIVSETNMLLLRNHIMDNCKDHDYEADLFYFSFMGKNGYFFLGADGDWKVSSDSNLAVEFDYSNSNDTNSFTNPFIENFTNSNIPQPKVIKGFTLYDDNGNKYIFGGKQTAIEYSIDLFNIPYGDVDHPWIAKSWYLTEVRNRFNQPLYMFNYTEGHYFIQLFHNESSTSVNEGAVSYTHTGPQYSGTLCRPVYLSSIFMKDHQSVHFSRSSVYPCGQTMQSLYPMIYYNGQLRYSILGNAGTSFNQRFYYIQYDMGNHTAAGYTEMDPFRGMDIQKLDSIYISGSIIYGMPSVFEFSYSTDSRLHLTKITNKYLISHQNSSTKTSYYRLLYKDFDQVEPDYLTDKHDAWGFQNMSNSSPEPSVYGIFRQTPNLYYSLKGMLQEIIYPTGGKSVLEYELNDYSSYLSLDRQSMIQEEGSAGGLRIKSIKEYEDSLGVNLLSHRQFSYINPTTQSSSGQLFAKPKYSWYWSDGAYTLAFEHDVPVIPLATSFGTHIGYSFIKETFADGTFWTYTYSNFSDSKDEPFAVSAMGGNSSTPFDRFGERNFMRGKILNESCYASDGQMLQSKDYYYRSDTSTINSRYSLASNIQQIPVGTPYMEVFAGGLFKRYYPKYDVESVVTTTHDTAGGSIRDSTYYKNKEYFVNLTLPINVHAPYFRKCILEQSYRGTDYVTKQYYYAGFEDHMYYQPLYSIKTYENGVHTLTHSIGFGSVEGYPQPIYETTFITENAVDTLVTYDNYMNGQLITYTRQGEHPTQLYWNSSGKLIATVTSPYSREQITCHTQYSAFTATNGTSQRLLHILEHNGTSIFMLPDTKAVVYAYDEYGLLRASVTGNAQISFFDYDGLGRLTEIQDADHNTLQRFTYNYSTSLTQ